MEKQKPRQVEGGLTQPTPRPGTRMLLIPPSSADPMRLAEESVERLKHERPPRPVKTSKRKRKAGQKSGPIGGGRVK